MLSYVPPTDMKSLYPHSLCFSTGASPWHSREVARGWLWLLWPSLAVPRFLFDTALTVFGGGLTTICSERNKFLGAKLSCWIRVSVSGAQESASPTPISMIFCTLSFKSHWANHHCSLPDVYAVLLPDRPAFWSVDDRCGWVWALTNDIQWYGRSVSLFKEFFLCLFMEYWTLELTEGGNFKILKSFKDSIS